MAILLLFFSINVMGNESIERPYAENFSHLFEERTQLPLNLKVIKYYEDPEWYDDKFLNTTDKIDAAIAVEKAMNKVRSTAWPLSVGVGVYEGSRALAICFTKSDGAMTFKNSFTFNAYGQGVDLSFKINF